MSYTHLTLEERKYLQKLLSEGYSQRKIAAILERSPSTISREIQRNRAKWKPHQKPDNPYWYNHWRAQNLYIRRRREQQRMALHPGTEAWEFIIAGLKQYWSPEAIAGRWHLEYPERKPLCVSTVYRYIKKSRFPKITPKTHLRRRGKRIQTRNANYNSIQPERIIPQWSEEIRQRARIGDWEGDTVYGGVGKGLPAPLSHTCVNSFLSLCSKIFALLFITSTQMHCILYSQANNKTHQASSNSKRGLFNVPARR